MRLPLQKTGAGFDSPMSWRTSRPERFFIVCRMASVFRAAVWGGETLAGANYRSVNPHGRPPRLTAGKAEFQTA